MAASSCASRACAGRGVGVCRPARTAVVAGRSHPGVPVVGWIEYAPSADAPSATKGRASRTSPHIAALPVSGRFARTRHVPRLTSPLPRTLRRKRRATRRGVSQRSRNRCNEPVRRNVGLLLQPPQVRRDAALTPVGGEPHARARGMLRACVRVGVFLLVCVCVCLCECACACAYVCVCVRACVCLSLCACTWLCAPITPSAVQAALREAQAQAQLARAEADVHAKSAAMAMQAWRALSAYTTNLRLPSGCATWPQPLRCESATGLAPRFALFRAGRARR